MKSVSSDSSALFPSSSLFFLDLSVNRLTAAGMPYLAAFFTTVFAPAPSPSPFYSRCGGLSLESLNLSQNPIGDAGVVILAEALLETMPGLSSFISTNCRLKHLALASVGLKVRLFLLVSPALLH
jgi:hypothetical protein